jgi:hypothetical protein
MLGKTFGRLTITKFTLGPPIRLEASCVCGGNWSGSHQNVLYGNTASCGCLYRETRQGALTHGHKSGGKVSKVYAAWQAMKTRCYGNLPENLVYRKKGIRVCKKWLSGQGDKTGFECFLADVKEPPTKLHTLERINNQGHYTPSNVRWATWKEQGNNKSNNKVLTAFGLCLTLPQWADKNGLNPSAIRNRLRRGWSVEKAVSTPLITNGNDPIH